jgi:ufm1-conjugating enzyme 1
VSYPSSAPEIEIPELEGKTVKMYRGGKICLTTHFKPLWEKNKPRFGIAHAIALGLSPWLATEIPHLVDEGLIIHPSASI